MYVLGVSLTAVLLYLGLEGTARNAGYTFSSCKGLPPLAETGQKKSFFMFFWLTLGHFCCSGVTPVTFSSNPS